MENRQKVLNLLGLAKRAGKLVTGEELVLKQIRNGQARLVLLASDCGMSTMKKISNKCDSYAVNIITEFTKQELSIAIGQSRTVIAVNDAGFSKKMLQLLEA
ncbi:YlxQ-related RNA-binding protein [Ligilactobacillus ceti]|uniref:Ribosomal protein eL8/eL30/eS12/Gadd45 domain-containing protein n=1 Tax=Ligilactobacillus ceti DSM 22408 TaxID=1122146 RepID=A0A0R2KGY4_9LACO|nr:YlxQ-related RNA-binding protein [Ligilactobacillus ceti]KRN88625.1 hypothetical protein IV53_GL000590 [Ligilactobacillus ceti DSM 22408]